MRNFEQEAYKMGYAAGESAAGWFFDGNTSTETYRRVAAGIEDGDPEILDQLPYPDLSGEWADSPTPSSVFEELGVPDVSASEDSGQYDYVLDAYEAGFTQGCEDEIIRACRFHLDDCPI